MGSPTNVESSAMQGMMDDLGIARLDELPLDERNNNRDRHRRNHGGGVEFRGRERRGRATSVAVDASLGNLWNNAIASGAFDDDDAAAVRGLSDLGGGRLYDATHPQRGAPTRRTTAMNQTLAILGYGGKRSRHVPAATPAPAPSFFASRQANPGRSWASYIQSRTPLAISHRRPVKRQSPALASSPVQASPVSAPVPSVQLAEHVQPSTLGLENVVFTASVKFLSRDINPALPAVVFLSAEPEPKLGSFIVLVYNRKFCEWPISAWNDYSTGADLVLGVRFMDQGGTSQGYELSFNSQDELMNFMTSMRSLKAGEYMGRVNAVSPSAVKPADPNIAPASASVPAAESQATAADLMTPVVGGGSGPSHGPREGPVKPSIPSTKAPIAEASSATLLAADWDATAATPSTNSDMVDGLIQEGTQTTKVDGLAEDPLIDLDAEDDVVVPDRAPSEAAELLSTLGPYEYENVSISGAPEAQLSRELIITTARSLLGVFLLHSMGGDTRNELAETVDGIKSGIMEFMVQRATDMGMSPQKLHEMQDMINDVFDSMRPPSLESSRTGGNKPRIQYTIEELLSLRQEAADPPASLANIFLPLRTPGVPRGGFRASHVQPQLERSAGAMDWVLGHAASPVPGTQSGQSSPAAASAKPAQNSGLKTSRWAAEGEQVKQENSFTGPAYERRGATRNHVQDLAELDPEVTVTSGAEVVINHFFPDSNRDEDRIGQADSHAAAPDGAAVAADNIETLRMRMSRLSIRSDTSQGSRPPQRSALSLVQAASETAARSSITGSIQPQPTPRLRGLGASRHSAGPGPASSGRFNFHLPQ
ncbi:hypothetical protein MFIFM68171_05329 [Madurella fahalii]|uniref:Uncharacterized protein n=1 Tax=Madurella fahalii TaxID=1157608 RepID=A0ABQ0GBR9_9PEZI